MQRALSSRPRISVWLILAAILAASLPLATGAHALPARQGAAQADKIDALAKINLLRAQNGVPPLFYNPALDQAAQRHCDDMAGKGFVDSIGSDGTSGRQRIEAAGYPGWGGGARPWSESVYAGQLSFDDALNFLVSDEGQRRPLLSSRFREVGIGIASDGVRTYWTITYASQPNVLPVTLNDGATVTTDPQVSVLLTQEEAVPAGGGQFVGTVVDVRLSDKPDFAKAEWQRWERLLPFTFDKKAGPKTLYVELRDAARRVTRSTAQITLDPKARVTVQPRGPGAVETLAIPTEPPQPTETPVPTVALIDAGRVAGRAPTSTAVQVNRLVIAESPTPALVLATAVTPSPLTPTPQVVAQIVSQPGAGRQSSVISGDDIPAPRARSLFTPRDQSALPEWVLPAFVALQALALGAGLVWILRRRS